MRCTFLLPAAFAATALSALQPSSAAANAPLAVVDPARPIPPPPAKIHFHSGVPVEPVETGHPKPEDKSTLSQSDVDRIAEKVVETFEAELCVMSKVLTTMIGSWVEEAAGEAKAADKVNEGAEDVFGAFGKVLKQVREDAVAMWKDVKDVVKQELIPALLEEYNRVRENIDKRDDVPESLVMSVKQNNASIVPETHATPTPTATATKTSDGASMIFHVRPTTMKKKVHWPTGKLRIPAVPPHLEPIHRP